MANKTNNFLRCSLWHAHKFRVFFCNRTVLRTASASLTTCGVFDSIVAFTPAPTPRSSCSLSYAHKFRVFFRNRTALWAASTSPTTYSISDNIVSHAHKFMGFFRNRTALRAASASPMTCSVSDIIVAFTPAPTPRSRCSLSHAHKFRGFPQPNRPSGSVCESYDLWGF